VADHGGARPAWHVGNGEFERPRRRETARSGSMSPPCARAGAAETATQRIAPLAIQYREVQDLIPYARNARTHSEAQVAQIAGSIREFGFTNPVLIDPEGGIIAGHGRDSHDPRLGGHRADGEPRYRHQPISSRIWRWLRAEGRLTMPEIEAIFGTKGWLWIARQHPADYANLLGSDHDH
jgi:hypothetical protein